jgi:hypothetical protein
MMNSYERSDIIHIMKMNRMSLEEKDTAQMNFVGEVKGKRYRVMILTVEGIPTISIKENRRMIHSETLRSVDDLKIFLEERMYQYLEG